MSIRDTLNSIVNMGCLLYMQGKHDEAEACTIVQALEWADAAGMGDEHLRHTRRRCNNMGMLLTDLGKYDEAEACTTAKSMEGTTSRPRR